MTDAPEPAPHTQVAYVAKTDDNIAPDLATLMERMERARKFLRVEREYIKLVLLGFGFLAGGTLYNNMWAWRIYLPLTLIFTPFVYAWLNLPKLRLANAFRNEAMPFLLRDYGRWNYAHEGAHFSRDAFFKVGFLDHTDGVAVSSISTGERYGVPLQFAVVSAWRHPMFGIYRGSKPNFAGWAANIRLPELPSGHALILPNGKKPLGQGCAGWTSVALTPSHMLWHAPDAPVVLPAPLVSRLLTCMIEQPLSQFGLVDGVLWVLVPGDGERFNLAQDFTVPLNESAPYNKARAQLAEIFAVLDKVVWPAPAANAD